MVAAVAGAHMMMQCPRCSTRWRVAAASPVDNPLFKCGRCHHLFRQFPGAPPPNEAAVGTTRRGAPPPSEPDTLEFIFPDRQSPALVLEDEPALPVREAPYAPTPDTMPDEPRVAAERMDLRHAEDTQIIEAPVIVPRPDVPVVPPAFADRDDAGMHDDQDTEHEIGDDLLAEPSGDEPVLGDLDEETDEDADQDDDEASPTVDTGRSFRVEDAMKAPAGFGTIMRALGTTVSAFAVLALVIRVAPEQASAWLANLPFAGASFAYDRNLTTKVELKNVQGRFQKLRNARRVFVISGEARNNSPMTIERIEVAGALYDLGGGELDQKVVTTGNRTALTELSEAEIVLLQRLDPAIALAPGETTPFLIVFLEPPRDLGEFSSRVLSVRPTRRASTPSSSSKPDSVG